MSRISILDVQLDAITRNEALKRVEAFLDSSKPSLICTPNTEIVVLARQNRILKDILNCNSNLNLVDGFGLIWAARFKTMPVTKIPVLKHIMIFLQWFFSLFFIPLFPHLMLKPIPERISGADIVWDIAKLASTNNLKIFLLGGGPTVAEQSALVLQTKLPDLRIAGVSSLSPENTIKTIEIIRKSKANVLLVAYGAPKQELWLMKNLDKTGCKIGMGVGGTFDFIAGTRKRAPLWLQKIGLEWLYRLIQEPRRFKRQLALPKFAILVLLEKLRSS